LFGALDGRNEPSYGLMNLAAQRHSGKGAVNFADGHVEAVAADYGLNPAHSKPLE
jgi:prepilin-type processing-associated H-X9-DG protein